MTGSPETDGRLSATDGATLGPLLGTVPGWEPYAPVVVGATSFAWAIASWWVPLLVVLDVWAVLTGGVEGRPPVWAVTLVGTGRAAKRVLVGGDLAQDDPSAAT